MPVEVKALGDESESFCDVCGSFGSGRWSLDFDREDGTTTDLCSGCAATLRKALIPAWKAHHKAEMMSREMTPKRMSMWKKLIEAHNAGVRMRDMSDEEFLHVLEVFEGEQCMMSIQSRIIQEAIRRLGGEDEWADENEDATER